jgi:hypothetical protein
MSEGAHGEIQKKAGEEIRMMVGPASNISNPPRRQLIRPDARRTPDGRPDPSVSVFF